MDLLSSIILGISKPYRTGANVLAQGYGPMYRGLTGGDPATPGAIESYIRGGITSDEQSYIDRNPYMAAAKSGAGIAGSLAPFATRAPAAIGLGGRTAQIAKRGLGEGALSGYGYSREGKELQDTGTGAGLGVASELLGHLLFDPSYRKMAKEGWDSLAVDGRYPAAMQLGGTKKRYHGTYSPLEEFSDDALLHSSEGNIYGRGFYTTDSPDVAKGYSKQRVGGMKQALGETPDSKLGSIYEVSEKGKANLYDLEQPIPESMREELHSRMFGEYSGRFKKKDTLKDVFDGLRREWDGSAWEVQGLFDNAINYLQEKGFQGFKHKGGAITGGKPHNVNIYWEPKENIILKLLRDLR